VSLTLFLALIVVEFGVFLFLYSRNLPKHYRTEMIKARFNPKGDSKMADLSLNVGQSSTGTVTPFLADGVTQTPGAVVTSATWSLTDPSVTVTTNADNTVTVTGVAATTAPVTGNVTAVITDSDGTVGTFTATFSITVGGGQQENRTASIGVSWSTPQ
jgi:hypothetical protein